MSSGEDYGDSSEDESVQGIEEGLMSSDSESETGSVIDEDIWTDRNPNVKNTFDYERNQPPFAIKNEAEAFSLFMSPGIINM